MSPEFADCYSVSFEETHGSAAISLLQHLYTLMQTLCLPSKRAADVQAEFHLRAPAQLGFLVASWHVLDHKMYFPDSEDNLRFVSFFFPPSLHNHFFKEHFPKFSWNGRQLPQLIQRHCLAVISRDWGSWLQTRGTSAVSDLLWLFLVRSPLSVRQTSACFGGSHVVCVVLNWIC